jgi:hypothetical protein
MTQAGNLLASVLPLLLLSEAFALRFVDPLGFGFPGLAEGIGVALLLDSQFFAAARLIIRIGPRRTRMRRDAHVREVEGGRRWPNAALGFGGIGEHDMVEQAGVGDGPRPANAWESTGRGHRPTGATGGRH